MESSSLNGTTPNLDAVGATCMWSAPVNWAAALLLTFESYHALKHFLVLFGLRMLPRQDLARQRVYFLFDTMTVFFTNFVFLRQLRWIAALQMYNHLSVVIQWEKAEWVREAISWSSLDWNYTYEHRFAWKNIIGTVYDLACHLANGCLLVSYLTPFHVFAALAVMLLASIAEYCNPRSKWCNPLYTPDWVRERCAVLDEPNVRIKKIA